jgi:two-component system sensor histidine kinase HydH
VTEESDVQELHDQVDRLSARIEAVVQELQQRQREVLRAEQLAAVGQLAAGVAHEIRNPLTSIKMLVQAGLEDGALPAEDLRVMEPEVRRMERSLRTFLDFARPPRPERRPTSLNEVVQHTVGLIQGRAAKQRVEVSTDLPPEGVWLIGDGQQLEQVLINLTLNSLDVMPSGGALKVSLRSTPTEAVIEVADVGPGLSPEVLERLFHPFVSSKPTGLGLGLVICRRIVEDHGGTVNAANGPNGGAVFTVRLPRTEDDACRPC